MWLPSVFPVANGDGLVHPNSAVDRSLLCRKQDRRVEKLAQLAQWPSGEHVSILAYECIQ